MPLHESLDALCRSVLDIDKNIQSAAVINNKGRVLEQISRPVFAEQFPDHLNELFCMHYVLQISMGRDFDERYGPINYHISERKRFTMLTLPVYDSILLVTIGKDTSPITLARKITNIIDDNRKQF